MDKAAGKMACSRWRLLYRGFRILYTMIILCVGVVLGGQFRCYGMESEPHRYVTEQSSLELQSRRAAQEKSNARSGYVNPETGYQVLAEDWAGLLTEEQLAELSEAMREITAYGNAAFVTTDRNAISTEDFARKYYMDCFGTDSGTVFVIDIEQRNIWIHSDGDVWKVITVANANTITDNVYRYASRGDYYECAAEAFAEIHALLKGERIARPMKYIGNALLAMSLALLANYGLVLCSSGLRRPREGAMLASIHRKFDYSGLKANHTHQTKVYDPVSSTSGGSSGGGGGSSGGGSRSGGGGGHKF